mmetsp:Transcript_33341/g.72810  ORF Transcript_33341/g.72810 Transcript_33341/m.72810 type:complete len:289 (+) Transcript_33341:80-946(+)
MPGAPSPIRLAPDGPSYAAVVPEDFEPWPEPCSKRLRLSVEKPLEPLSTAPGKRGRVEMPWEAISLGDEMPAASPLSLDWEQAQLWEPVKRRRLVRQLEEEQADASTEAESPAQSPTTELQSEDEGECSELPLRVNSESSCSELMPHRTATILARIREAFSNPGWSLGSLSTAAPLMGHDQQKPDQILALPRARLPLTGPTTPVKQARPIRLKGLVVYKGGACSVEPLDESPPADEPEIPGLVIFNERRRTPGAQVPDPPAAVIEAEEEDESEKVEEVEESGVTPMDI